MKLEKLLPLASSPDSAWRSILGVLTDIDDTLTHEGRIETPALAAMEQLRAAGLLVIPVTGRPAGWCDLIARQWPVDAVVGENGAFYFRYDEDARRMIRVFSDSKDVRTQNRRKLESIASDVLAEIPGAAISADQHYRECDLAVDFCEDVAPLSRAAVGNIIAIFERHGATAKVSSIHVNGWFGAHDKLTMTKQLLRDQFSHNPESIAKQFTFAGDSPNDAPMFAFFTNAIGVANLSDYADDCDALPQWITASARGAGFVEIAERILSVR